MSGFVRLRGRLSGGRVVTFSFPPGVLGRVLAGECGFLASTSHPGSLWFLVVHLPEHYGVPVRVRDSGTGTTGARCPG